MLYSSKQLIELGIKIPGIAANAKDVELLNAITDNQVLAIFTCPGANNMFSGLQHWDHNRCAICRLEGKFEEPISKLTIINNCANK